MPRLNPLLGRCVCWQVDGDGDLIGDACDLCPAIVSDNSDMDLDTIGDQCGESQQTSCWEPPWAVYWNRLTPAA
jgi:hypothetical protein